MDLDFEDFHVFFPQKGIRQSKGALGKQLTLFDVLPNGNKFPEAVFLSDITDRATYIAIRERVTRSLNNGENVKLNNQRKNLIRPYVKDAIVYSRNSIYSKCSVFEDLVPRFQGKNYVLNEIDKPDTKDRSLNRCTESESRFQYMHFKLGKLTPKQENDCSGPHFILSEEPTASVHQTHPPITDPDIQAEQAASPIVSRSPTVRLYRNTTFTMQAEEQYCMAASTTTAAIIQGAT